MPIAEIITEIDAYLSRLRQARELLSNWRTETPQEKGSRRKDKVVLKEPEPASFVRRRTEENKTPSNAPAAHLKKVRKRVDTSAQVPTAVANHPSHSEQATAREPERPIPDDIAITRLPSRRRISSIRPARHRTAATSSGVKGDAVKPAIALAGPMSAKIVVVSAEQAQRERDQAAQPAVRRPRLPASGLSGRTAFEALFSDTAKPFNSSEK